MVSSARTDQKREVGVIMENKKQQMSKGMRIKEEFQTHPQLGALGILIIASVCFALLAPVNKEGVSAFITLTNLSNVIEQTTAISITAFGMTMVLLIGGIDLSLGSIIGLVNMVGCQMLMLHGWPIFPTVLLMLAIGLVAGLINGFLIVRFNVQPFLITMSMMTILRGIIYAVSRGESVFLTDMAFCDIFCRGNVFGVPVTALWTILFLIIMYIVASKSRFGRNVQAVGGNEIAARNSGVNVVRIKISTYMISGAMAAIAGMVTMARLGSANCTIGTGAEMNAIAAAVLGGTSFNGDGGNMVGTVLGSLVMGVFVNGLNILGVDSYYQDIIKGLIIVVAVIGSNYLISRDRKA